MSSDPPSAGPSPAAEGTVAGRPKLGLSAVVRLRGIALLEALERHVPGARQHAEATGSYAFATAVTLGLDRTHADAVREAAKLHDIGLVYIGAATLRKAAGELDDDERSALAKHPSTGAQLAHGAGIPDEVCEWLRRWAEPYESNADLPLESRIIHAACRCDAALSAPGVEPDRRAETVASYLRSVSGSLLDPGATQALASILERS